MSFIGKAIGGIGKGIAKGLGALGSIPGLNLIPGVGQAVSLASDLSGWLLPGSKGAKKPGVGEKVGGGGIAQAASDPSFLQKLGQFLGGGLEFLGGGNAGTGASRLGGLGLGALSLLGSSKDRGEAQKFAQGQIDTQTKGLERAEEIFGSKAPMRKEGMARALTALSRPSFFQTSAQRGKPAGYTGGSQ